MVENYGDEPDSTSDDFGKLSKINAAGLINITTNNLWTDFFAHIRKSSFFEANNDLDCIWTILGGEKGVKGEDTEKEFKEIQEKLINLDVYLINKDRPTLKDIARIAIYRKILMEKALFLRRLQNSQGKGTAYHDEDEGDF